MLKTGRQIETIPEELKFQAVVGQTYPSTPRVWLNELVNGLAEINMAPPDYQAPHRYQCIWVERDDKIAEYRHSLGLASTFGDVLQFQIPAMWLHTVDELMDMAYALRDPDRPLMEMHRQRVAEIQYGDMVGDWRDRQEENQKLWDNSSNYGPAIAVQRQNQGEVV